MLILSKQRVYRLEKPLKCLTKKHIDYLVQECRLNSWPYARICLHESESSLLMSMVLVMVDRFVYPPHRHPWKTESYVVLRGVADLELYDLETKQLDVSLTMRTGDSFHNDYFGYHTFTPKTDVFVFLESTHGPLCDQEIEFL